MSISKVMVVDRDRDTIDMIEAAKDNLGLVQVDYEAVRNSAIERLHEERYHAVFFDPSPNTEELRSFIIGARRNNNHYIPVTVMSRQVTESEAYACGANDYLQKSVVLDEFKSKIRNMKNLTDLIERLKEDHRDFVSRDGVISKTAFYQIFISSLDRADRYGEETYLIFVRIDNIHDLQQMYGEEVTEIICDKMKKYTVKIRRLSDIVGRTAPNELCLMLVRPMNQNEPIMAVQRFADSMSDYAPSISEADAKAQLSVHLMALPSGKIVFSETCY